MAPGSKTKLMALKAGDASGSLYLADEIAAINYASNMGANIISMSFSGTGYSGTEQTAIINARNNGVVLFAAAGNSGDSTMQYPVGYNGVIGVGATDNRDAHATFSTYNSSVDVSAPGVDIYSTMPGYAVTFNKWYSQNYAFMSGTSMATPTAAGTGALVHSRNPTLTPAQVESVIETNADDLGGSGRDDYFGYGRINAFQTLNAITINPIQVPTITGLSPTSKMAGQPAFTLTVNGTNFVAGSVVRWNGGNRTTTYVSATQLTAAITASDIASAGTVPVTVFNPTPGGGTSNAQTFNTKFDIGSFSWSYAGQSSYTDSGKTASADPDQFYPGETAWWVVKAKNTGSATWTNTGNNPVDLCTSHPNDRGCGFATPQWPGTNRPSGLKESSVKPGETGTFEFPVRVPSDLAPGTYNEYFNLVAEGETWFNDPGLYFPVVVH